MKKILHILVLPKMAGSQKIALEILRGLPDTEYDKWVLFSAKEDTSPAESDYCEERFREAGARVLYSKHMKRAIGPRDIPATREIYRLCRKERFDIVHTHSTKPGIIGRFAATLAGVPLVIHTVHGLAFHQFVKFPKWQFYWCCEMIASLFCHKIVLVNRFYRKHFKAFRHKTQTVYNGVDFGLLPAPLPAADEPGHPKILFVGRLDRPKDPLTLLKAARIVVDRIPQARFTLVGDGEKYDECVKFVRDNGLEENVTLAGWQDNVAPFYASHRIFVAPSIYESFGLMFVEAGYYRLPVVATCVEGIPEIVLDNKTGLLSEPGDPEKIAGNIIRLIDDPALRRQMGQAAYEYVTGEFSAEKMVEQYRKIYENSSDRR